MCFGHSLSVEHITLDIPFDFSQPDIALIHRWMTQVSLSELFFRGEENKYWWDLKRGPSCEWVTLTLRWMMFCNILYRSLTVIYKEGEFPGEKELGSQLCCPSPVLRLGRLCVCVWVRVNVHSNKKPGKWGWCMCLHFIFFGIQGSRIIVWVWVRM